MSIIKKLQIKIYKAFRFEFWPWPFMFIPVLPMYLLSVLRTRKWLYFTAVNPSIEMGGFFGEKKDEIMELIPDEYKPLEFLVRTKDGLNSYIQNAFTFPVFVKPNVGERGYEVREVNSMEELREYADKGFDFLIQEKLNQKLELGVLFHLNSGSKGIVSSIALKKFMTVVGNGRSSVRDLVLKNRRHSLYLDYLEYDFSSNLSEVPLKGEEFVIHKIGNHCKGTQFLNANHRITDRLNATFSRIASQIPGFDYGRFDLKVESFEDLESGKFKIFELNGISSEPGHIYGYKWVVPAYLSLYKHWNYIAVLSKKNIKKGVKTTPLKLFIKQVFNHFFT